MASVWACVSCFLVGKRIIKKRSNEIAASVNVEKQRLIPYKIKISICERKRRSVVGNVKLLYSLLINLVIFPR